LQYERVYRLKRDFPDLPVSINGGITSAAAVATHLAQVDGVMLGRAAYHDPWLLVAVESLFEPGASERATRHEVARAMLPYIDQALQQGTRLQQVVRHMLGLFQGQPGAKAWRRYLSERAHRDGAGCEVVERALALVPEPQGAPALAGRR